MMSLYNWDNLIQWCYRCNQSNIKFCVPLGTTNHVRVVG